MHASGSAGSGETMACGSGACAVAVAANEAGLRPAAVIVRFRGGALQVERRKTGRCSRAGRSPRVSTRVIDPDELVG